MKTLQLLPLCGISVLADSIPRGHGAGLYGVQCLSDSPLLTLDTGTICRANSTSPLLNHSTHGRCDNNNYPHSHPPYQYQHNWTHTSPCITSSTSSQKQYCVFSDSAFASGRGTTLVTSPKRAAYMSRSTPAFTNPNLTLTINQDLTGTTSTIPAKYTVQAIPGKGLGVIATTFIARGELIMANTPSIMIDYGAFADLAEEEYLSLQASGIDVLPPSHRERVLSLSTHDSGDSNLTFTQQVEKVINTNAFDIDPLEDDEEQEHGFYVVFPEIARMNHDCRPNADYWYDDVRLSQWVHAVRDIYPGEEVTISYIDPVQKRQKRKQRLKRTWGFECSCAACTAGETAGAASDDRVGQMLELVSELRDETRESRASPQMAELVVGLYELERLWGQVYEVYALAAVEWNGVGDAWTATKWARRAVEFGIWSVGGGDEDVRDMERLATDPWGHWSWMRRTKTRMGGG